MAHEVETMAYLAGQVPWHGLGNAVRPDATIDEMEKAAGLDWTVDQRPLYWKDPATGEYRVVSNHKAWVRSKDKQVMTVSGNNWHGNQNREFLNFFKQYAFKGGAQISTAGSLRGGKLVWALLDLGHEFWVGKRKDKVRGYLLASWSHVTGRSNRLKLVQTRVVCNNTLEMAFAEESRLPEYTQSHLKSFDFDKAKQVVGLCHDALNRQKAELDKLTKTKVSQFDIVKFLQPLLQPGVAEEQLQKLMDPANQNDAMKGVLLSVVKAPGAQEGTAWGVLNGVTHWADHVAGRSADARLSRSWFGDRRTLKRDVTTKLLQLAA